MCHKENIFVVLNCNSVYKLYFVGGCKSLVFLDVSHRKEAVAFNCVIFCRCMRRGAMVCYHLLVGTHIVGFLGESDRKKAVVFNCMFCVSGGDPHHGFSWCIGQERGCPGQ